MVVVTLSALTLGFALPLCQTAAKETVKVIVKKVAERAAKAETKHAKAAEKEIIEEIPELDSNDRSAAQDAPKDPISPSPYGIHTISDPEDAIADIVFVHGLRGHREKTWTHAESKTFWPRDLLHQHLRNKGFKARLLSFGYDADVVSRQHSAAMSCLQDLGNSLASDLANLRRDDASRRPLIFVAHSMGGLVCEEALLVSRSSPHPLINALLESTLAISFMGTPHHGSKVANWTALGRNLYDVVGPINKNLLRLLQPNSEVLAALQQNFHGMLRTRRNSGKREIEMFCFVETRPVGRYMIVPSNSAILPQCDYKSIEGTNHITMTKFSSHGDPGFKAVADLLSLWLERISVMPQNLSAVPPKPDLLIDLDEEDLLLC